ncbi:MAG: hypothetical protein VX278_03945 [Myxococcota bacterium]|nr:hypothetical protein [Myxococcota bacterium]
MSWPNDFVRIPSEEWTRTALEELAMKYDTVEEHGWYDNLEPTVEEILQNHESQEVIIDYSGGTGILADRMLRKGQEQTPHLLIIDASPKFLRLSLEKFRHNPKIAFRLIRYLRPERRLEYLEEVLPPSLYRSGVDAIVSTNAIHLYYQHAKTLESWRKILRSDGIAYVQSGNIRNPNAPENTWIIDETVEAIHKAACTIVASEDEYAHLRPLLQKEEYMRAHDKLRAKYFIPVRPLSYYTDHLQNAGFQIEYTQTHTIHAMVDQWFDFLAVYHEGVLGWVGGAQKITKQDTPADIVALRKQLIRRSMDVIFDHKDSFDAVWTYIKAQKQ